MMSGVVVPSTIRSSSDALTPAASSALLRRRERKIAGGLAVGSDMPLADAGARCGSIRRWYRRVFSRSALVTTRSGSALPVAMMRA